MRPDGFFRIVPSLIVIVIGLLGLAEIADSASPELEKAKREAEARGYILETSHDQIVAKAKEEGGFQALVTVNPRHIRALRKAFNKRYPFIQASIGEFKGADTFQRFVLELKAGRGVEWDAIGLSTALYDEYIPFQKKFDILGMAQHGVLNIPPEMVDPVHRNVVATTGNLKGVAYNKKLLPPDQVPDQWEDFLRPQFKGRKFLVPIRPHYLATLVPGMGLERTLAFVRKVAAQEPIWTSGQTKGVTLILSGEASLFMVANLHSTSRLQARDKSGTLGFKLVEPIPTKISDTQGILATAQHPYSALLWLEFQASPEAQEIADKYGPYNSSHFVPGSAIEKMIRGKKLSLTGWEHQARVDEYAAKIAEAAGFPKADK